MFKNFSKVFKFTFHNQVTTKGYKIGTILFAILLFAVPAVVLFFMGASSEEDEEGIKSCGADKIYVVSDNTPLEDFNSLNALGVEEYTAIEYIPAKSVDDALDTVKAGDEKTSLILEITYEDRISERIIIPENSNVAVVTGFDSSLMIIQAKIFHRIDTGGIYCHFKWNKCLFHQYP